MQRPETTFRSYFELNVWLWIDNKNKETKSWNFSEPCIFQHDMYTLYGTGRFEKEVGHVVLMLTAIHMYET